MSILLRKKKQQTGAIHLLGPEGRSDWTIPIEFKPHLVVQVSTAHTASPRIPFALARGIVPVTKLLYVAKDLINLAAEKAQIKPTAVSFFGLYDPERRYWLYPFRCLEKSEASMHWYFRVQFKVKNSVELRRLDSVAFEYYIMQVMISC